MIADTLNDKGKRMMEEKTDLLSPEDDSILQQGMAILVQEV